MQAPSSNFLLGFIDELSCRFTSRYGIDLQSIEDETESKIDSLLGQLSRTELEELLKTIRDRRGLVSVNPAYGNEIISISKQILSFGGAGIGLAAAFSHNLAELPIFIQKLMGVAILFYANLIGLSLFTIFGFIWQSRFRYPFLYFRKIGNTVPFFYYQAISPETPRSIFQTAAEKRYAAELYGKDLIRFLQHLLPGVPNSAPEEATAGIAIGGRNKATEESAEESKTRLTRRGVRDELQQYFLLIAYQGYVNQYEVKMNNDFLYGLMASVGAAAILAIYVCSLG
jgi:hypothetical protein